VLQCRLNRGVREILVQTQPWCKGNISPVARVSHRGCHWEVLSSFVLLFPDFNLADKLDVPVGVMMHFGDVYIRINKSAEKL